MADQKYADYITIKGFKSFRNLEKLPLKPINVLIGSNGSGKSNFIGAFSLLAALRRGRLADYTAKCGGADNVLWFGSKETEMIELELSFKDGVNGYHVELLPSNDDQFYSQKEYCWFWDRSDVPDRTRRANRL